MVNQRMPPPLPKPKLLELPPALAEVMKRAPESGILRWLEEFESAVDEAARECEDLGHRLISGFLHLTSYSGDDRPSGMAALNYFLALAGASQAAMNFFKSDERSDSLCSLARLGLSMSLSSLGGLIADDDEAHLLLQRALELGEENVLSHSKDENPSNWLRAQEIRAMTLRRQKKRAANDQDLRGLLEREVEAWETAVRISKKLSPPRHWSKLQIALSEALLECSDHVDDADARNMLERAADVQEESLKHLDRESEPQHWSMAQENLGNARINLAGFESDEKARRIHVAAGEAFKAALECISEEEDPERWTRINFQLVKALRLQAVSSSKVADPARH